MAPYHDPLSTEMATNNAAIGNHRPVALNRTCQDCRQRKIKCTLLSQEGASHPRKCTRCSKLGLDCVFLRPAIRKTRRRNETRIKELEHKLEAIHDAVAHGRVTGGLPQHSGSEPSHPLEEERSPPAFSKRLQSPGMAAATNEASPQMTAPKSFDLAPVDAVTGDFVDSNLARELYQKFYTSLAPLYPLVLVPEPLIWQTVRKDRPILFQAVLTAASTGVDPSISERLFQETGKLLAEKVVVTGEKSLDLVQTLLILATWHHPPKRFQDLKFSQYAHMAATMVMDLRSSNDERYKIPLPDEPLVPSEQLIEACRTFLACYFLCSSMALSLRRPNMLCYDRWVEDCIRLLEMLPFINLNDRRLIAWAKLQKLAERSLTAIGLDKGLIVDWSDSRTRFILRGCLEQVTEWRQIVPNDVMSETLEMHYHMILINLHEPALHDGHNLEDFRPPYIIRALPLMKKTSVDVSSEAANSLTQCIESAQNLLRIFLSIPNETLLSVPIVTYTRMTYALIVLIKCYVTMRSNDSTCVIESSPARFLSQIRDKLDSAAGEERFRVPAVFHHALSNMTKWCTEHFDRHSGSGLDGLIEPMIHINFNDDDGSAHSLDNKSTDDRVIYEAGSGHERITGQSLISSSASRDGESASINDMWPEFLFEEPLLEYSTDFFGLGFGLTGQAL